MMSTFEQLGGAAGIRAFVDELTVRIDADPVLGPMFAEVDPLLLNQHREKYFAAVFGGPEGYSGRGLREAHASLSLTDEAYDRFLRIVDETLAGLGANVTAAIEVRALLERLRLAIVSPDPRA